MNICDVLGKKIIIADGGMGTLLQQKLSGDYVPDELNLSKPGLIESIHYDYVRNGADFITTNTFGASLLKLKEVELENDFERINEAAVKIARKVADNGNGIWVAGDIGPSGKMVEPLGEYQFDEIVSNFASQAIILKKSGVDFILIETITDVQEFRAAVIASLANVDIPVIACMAFTNGDLSSSGTDGSIFAITSDFIGLTGIGSNCGGTFDDMKKVISKMARYSTLPLLCQPNAGLPEIENGKTVYKLKPDEFVCNMEDIYNMGVAILGSCCGSTPDFTRKISEKFEGREVVHRNANHNTVFSSRTRISEVSGKKIFLVGERINPSGRKKLKKELEAGKLNIVRLEAKAQEKRDCDVLDININLHHLEHDTLRDIIKRLQNITAIPLMIDSVSPIIIETFAKLYAGKGIINSVSGKAESLDAILPIAAKYNMAIVISLMDRKGIPDSSSERMDIARTILKRVQDYKIPMRNIIIDPLVLSAATNVEKVRVTLDTLSLIKKEFPEIKTIIGLSNISFGLPNRELINATFLAMAADRGLDMVIANPMEQSLAPQLLANSFLTTGDKEILAQYTSHYSGIQKKKKEKELPSPQEEDNLYYNVINGETDSAKDNIQRILVEQSPISVMDEYLLPGMEEVGRRFRNGEYFLPQLMASADVIKAVMPFINKQLSEKNEKTDKPKVVFASVRGDIHDIGKNIVISILESYNYDVIDLGKDVSPDIIVAESVKNKAEIIGLSSLMTTTLPAMFETVDLIKESGLLKDVKIFIGGAVITGELAAQIGAVYAKDGIDMVNQLKKMLEEGKK